MIYFDNSATTRTYDQCADIIRQYLTEQYYNPSALYSPAVAVKMELDRARKTIADYLGVESECIYFCGSGTEADNTILAGVKKVKGGNLVISALEHSAVVAYAQRLENMGYELRVAPVDSSGKVIVDSLLDLVDDKTFLVSVMNVSNETGAINDIVPLSKRVKGKNPNVFFMSDGVQAFGKLRTKLRFSEVDAYTMSAHKIGGAKGCAAYYIRKGARVSPLLLGGGQERGMRPSTENVAGIIAFAEALRLITADTTFLDRVSEIRYRLIDFFEDEMPEVIINTSTADSLPCILSVAFPDINSEILLHTLERDGIMVGIGSACDSNKKERRTATALGLPDNYKTGIMRFSFGVYNTLSEADEVVCSLRRHIGEIIKK